MKRAVTPFLLLVALALLALFAKTSPHPLPPGDTLNTGDVAWMLTASALVLLMTPGLSFFYGGMVSFKNVVSTMLQSVIALGVISLLWVFVGFGLAFGDDFGGLVGNPLSFFMFDNVSDGTGDPGRGRGSAEADDPASRLLDVPAQVRDHHAGADHRLVCRAGTVLGLPLVHSPLQPIHLLSAGALDLASPGNLLQVGGEGLCRWDRRTHVGRAGGPGRCDLAGPAQEPPGQRGT